MTPRSGLPISGRAEGEHAIAEYTSKLTREHQFDLAVKQIAARESRYRWGVVALVVLGVVVATIAGFAIVGSKPPARNPDPTPVPAPVAMLDEVEISDIGFAKYESDSKAPRLDIKLTNRGTRLAFIKEVNLKVMKAWHLQPLPQNAEAVVPPSHDYKLLITPGRAPESYLLKVSHGIKPDDPDRFTVQVEEDPWAGGNSIYLMKAEIIANAKNDLYPSKDLLCLISQYSTLVPDRAGLDGMAKVRREGGQPFDENIVMAAIRTNRAILLEVAKTDGVRSPALNAQIEAALKSDIR